MTRQGRSLTTPVLEPQAFASRATSRSSHPFTLAELANDAAGGHVGQRWALSRVRSGTYHGFYESDSTATWLIVRAIISRRATASLADITTLTLSVTDGTTTVTTAADGIPSALDTSPQDLFLPSGSEWMVRTNALGVQRFAISLEELRATLTASTRWRFKLVVAAGSSHYVELFSLEEVSRFVVDTSADTFGQLPQSYLPRGLVVDGDPGGLPRIGATLEAAFDRSRRTYYARSTDESTPWSTTSTSFVALSGDSEPGGASVQTVTRGRKLRTGAGSTCRVLFRVRYRLTPGTPGDSAVIRLHTGASGAPYSLTLPDTSGAWADSDAKVAFIKTSAPDGLDALYWTAKTTSGTLDVIARGVWDHPL